MFVSVDNHRSNTYARINKRPARLAYVRVVVVPELNTTAPLLDNAVRARKYYCAGCCFVDTHLGVYRYLPSSHSNGRAIIRYIIYILATRSSAFHTACDKSIKKKKKNVFLHAAAVRASCYTGPAIHTYILFNVEAVYCENTVFGDILLKYIISFNMFVCVSLRFLYT